MQIWSAMLGWKRNSFIHNSSLHLFLVIVKKSKHKLLLLQCHRILLCNNMCSGLRINDLVISPSPPLPLDVMLHLLTTRSAFGLNSFLLSSINIYPSPLCLTEITKKSDCAVSQWKKSFYRQTRNTVNTMMFIKCARLWFRKSSECLMTHKKETVVQLNNFDFQQPLMIWFSLLSFLVETFDRCWIMGSLRSSFPRTSPNLRRHCFQAWKVRSLN